ncbi:centrosomal protein CEP57L1 [Oryzias melastigma]|uniref:Centrosomal protein 57kDa-like protein 1 n=1 Tax=Oryzias melastigma TaxID=30732 RepID=A0A3B3DCL6_ORYME|nr:centrosomal protein CEP57L1 [Oryzias melastigma]
MNGPTLSAIDNHKLVTNFKMMEVQLDQNLDSPSKNSYIGSYYQPPERILSVSRELQFPAHSPVSADQTVSHSSQTTRNLDSKGVVDALKTLQEKIRRLELERKQTERTYIQVSHDAQRQPSQTAASVPGTDYSAKTELDLKLQSAESRCKILEKQLEYMRKMVENAKKDKSAVLENQASLQNQQTSNLNNQTQQDKLEKLESECLKLSRTQTLAETKLAVLEQKLLQEEHERKLIQEKAEELQREFDISLRLSVPVSEETKPQRKTKKAVTKPSSQHEQTSCSPRRAKMPFVAGTSTSPSHSVHANVQSILHMMKHHHPQLCERASSLHKPRRGAKKSLQKDFSPPPTPLPKSDRSSTDLSLSSLTDLLLTLQDELGQMSFEHQELVGQIEASQSAEQKQELHRDLEKLTARMEEKEAQITKLRKHQQQIRKLTQSQSHDEGHTVRKRVEIKPPAPSTVKAKQTAKSSTRNNLQLLRETKKLRSSLKQDDISWET